MKRYCYVIALLFLLVNSLDAATTPSINIHELRQSIKLGDTKFQISTENSDAREHVLLGVAFLHAFMYDLAIQQFQQAQKLDPGFAMSYWGEAMAYKHPIWNYENLPAGRQALARYNKNKDQRRLNRKEQFYLKAANALFGQDTLPERDAAYLSVMQQFYRQFPDDPNVGAFYALSLLGIASDFPDRENNATDITNGRQLIDKLFKTFPDHPGVVHYYLHYHDNPDPEIAQQALPAAKIALNLMSSSSHVTHMSAHIYRRLQRWDDYIRANKMSIEAADHLCKQLNDQPLYACNAENKYHSLEWLHDGYLKTGQIARANDLVDRMARVVSADSDILYKQWYYRMWARQVLVSKNRDTPAITVVPISKSDDKLYWSAYSECAALQASAFLALQHDKPVDSFLKRLNTVIDLTNTLSDPYIKQACQISAFKVRYEQAKKDKNRKTVAFYHNNIRQLEKKQISTELTPSLTY
ncbi:hypothetical protein [Legionella spiritensis]|uniref:hypothetical protein n=1 Tax=Legionella spiritensis TaxID=452 RepID=UPI000F6B9AA0|nr:hypothetical protein [Legionella spiritensis]VEG90128.1 Uncharacterised protein [Legionella spiritensis]